MYRLCMLTFRKWAKVAYQIRKDLCPNNFFRLVSGESANNHIEEMAKEMTAEGAKGRKRGQYKSYLVYSLHISMHCTNSDPTLSHVQLWAER